MFPRRPADRIRQTRPEELGRRLVRSEHRFPLRLGCRIPLGIRFRDLDTKALGQLSHRVLKP